MNREQIGRAFRNYDQAFNGIQGQQMNMMKTLNVLAKNNDRMYYRSLTHEMMWDVLIGLLSEKGMITKEQFDKALNELSERTKAAMEAEAKKAAEAEEASKVNITPVSDIPAIPVTK
jgi:hypothetical protein